MEEKHPYAVIASGGKQYIVKVGDIIDLERVPLEEKATFECREVLFYTDGNNAQMGQKLSKAIVRGEVINEVRGPKVIAYKYKKRKKYRLKHGHRQTYTRVRITELAV